MQPVSNETIPSDRRCRMDLSSCIRSSNQDPSISFEFFMTL